MLEEKRMREKLMRQIEAYEPYNEQEKKDKELILSMLKSTPELFLRENGYAHMTASAWIVNETMDKALMAYHNIYHSWSWLGGHADGDEDLLRVALKEAREESGIVNVRPYSEDIFSIEVLTVDGHVKNGNYVSSHLHLNVTYLLIADEKDMLEIKADENSGVRWFPLREAVDASTEKWFQERIYSKLNERVINLRGRKGAD